MKYQSNEELLAKCQDLDFSAESTNYEKNLENLKAKLTATKERNYIMNKFQKLKSSVAIAAALIVLLSVSAFAFGETIWNYLETRIIQGEEYVNYFSIKQNDEYTVSIVEIDFNASGPIIAEIDGIPTLILDISTFDDLDEAISHLRVANPLVPAYLPAGLTFEEASFSICPVRNPEEAAAGQDLNIIYSSEQARLRIHILHHEAEWGAFSWMDDLEEIKVNGHSGLIGHGMLSLQIGNTAYIIDSVDLSAEQLIEIAASLQ